MIKEKLINTPSLPGVYLFKDKENNIIYVGKAKSLKKRVLSYFNKTHKDVRLSVLAKEAVDLDVIITKTEIEAFLLEAQIVREKQPKYNIQLKEGQPYLYFLISQQAPPQFKLVRNKTEKGCYFGPINRRWQARRAFEFLQKNFQLKICKTNFSKGGCLDYHLSFCVGLCANDFDKDAYLFRLELVKNLLKEDYDFAKILIQDKIQVCNKELKFEESGHLTQYLRSFNYTINALKSCFNQNKFVSSIAYASSEMAKEKFATGDIAEKLSRFFELSEPVRTIDCFDISHFQSRAIVGSCVRFLNGVPLKSKFRRFKIKTLTEQNDYAALQEIVSRRYRDSSELPDLVMIDGGKGQLGAIKDIISEVPLIALAKREETLFYWKHTNGLKLDQKCEIGRSFMAIRDYAHHFAISYHRNRRDKI